MSEAGWMLEDWVWGSRSPSVQLSSDNRSAYFFVDPTDDSYGTAAVRGSHGFTTGVHYWEVVLLEPALGTSLMFGIGTIETQLHYGNYSSIDLLGYDTTSWGLSYKGLLWHAGKKRKYCGPFFDENTVIGCQLDLHRGTMTYFQNGDNLGVAFEGLNDISKPLYPMISSTSTGNELELGLRKSQYSTLALKCCSVIAKEVRTKDNIEKLPLPNMLKNQLCDWL